jgi:hypothetical protein
MTHRFPSVCFCELKKTHKKNASDSDVGEAQRCRGRVECGKAMISDYVMKYYPFGATSRLCMYYYVSSRAQDSRPLVYINVDYST